MDKDDVALLKIYDSKPGVATCKLAPPTCDSFLPDLLDSQLAYTPHFRSEAAPATNRKEKASNSDSSYAQNHNLETCCF